MTRVVDADYLVVGAGATGMAFTDALIGHGDARVALVDRRNGPGGHWLDAYGFVHLHQASTFYGVASTPLGGGRVQHRGPEAGLHERATAAEITTYYERVLREELEESGRVAFFGGCEHDGAGSFHSRISGERFEVRPGCRIVDAAFLAPDIPASTPPPFEVAEGATVIPVHGLPRLDEAPSQLVVVGAGKTATDACIWLLSRGVAPDAICWVRPRDPWMTNRARLQPDPVVIAEMTADMLQAAADASSLDDLFHRLEDADILVRVDRSVMPTMAKAPTLAAWELELLRAIEHVVRLGHVRRAEPGRLVLESGSVEIARDAVVVHCAAAGLKYRHGVPIWGADAIRPQPVRAGFPCFGAALAGYVEATRDDDAEKNRLCPPNPFPDTPADWAAMSSRGARNVATFMAEPDVAEWSNRVPLNPARIPPDHPGSPALSDARARVGTLAGPGLAALGRFGGVDEGPSAPARPRGTRVRS